MVRPLTDEERKAMVAKFLDEQKKLQVAPKIENTKTTKSNSKLPLGAKTPPEQMPTGWQSTGRNKFARAVLERSLNIAMVGYNK